MFGTLPVAGKLVFAHFSPAVVTLVRIAVAALVFVALERTLVRGRLHRPGDLGRFALYALLGVALNQFLFLLGLQRTSAIRASILVATIPVWTALLAFLLGRERFRAMRFAGVGVALFGTIWLTTDGFRLTGDGGDLAGDSFVVLNAISYALYLVLARDVLSRYEPLTVIAWVFAFGTLWVVPAGVPALAAEGLSGRPTEGWLALGWIILVPTVGSYLLNMWALRHAESSQVAIFIFFQPVVAFVLAALILGERPGSATVAGGLLVLAGVLVASVRRRRPVPLPQAPPST